MKTSDIPWTQALPQNRARTHIATKEQGYTIQGYTITAPFPSGEYTMRNSFGLTHTPISPKYEVVTNTT